MIYYVTGTPARTDSWVVGIFFSTTGQRISQGSRFGGLDVKGMWNVNHGPWLPWPFHVNFERNGDPQKMWPQFRIL